LKNTLNATNSIAPDDFHRVLFVIVAMDYPSDPNGKNLIPLSALHRLKQHRAGVCEVIWLTLDICVVVNRNIMTD
jgi:hypothetical protein